MFINNIPIPPNNRTKNRNSHAPPIKPFNYFRQIISYCPEHSIFFGGVGVKQMIWCNHIVQSIFRKNTKKSYYSTSAHKYI